MPTDYRASDALRLLLDKLDAQNERLAASVRNAIDAGRDSQERLSRAPRAGREKSYRKIVPFSDAEALKVAVGVLRAHLIEQPLFVISAAKDFADSPLSSEPEGAIDEPRVATVDRRLVNGGSPKALEIELRTETQLTDAPLDSIALAPPDPTAVADQQARLDRLEAMLQFNDGVKF